MSLSVLSVLVGGATRTGGPPAFVGGSALELARLGDTMRVMATDLALAPTGWFQRQRAVERAELHPTLVSSGIELFAARFPRRLAYSPALRRAIDERMPKTDVVHIHNLWQFPQYAAYKSTLAEGVPYVVSPHGGLDPYLRKHGRARKRLMMALWQQSMLDDAALIHVTTRTEEDLIADIAPHVPRAVVPCGIYTDEFTSLPGRDVLRRKHLGGYDGPVILFLGRITYKKGVDILVRSVAHARRRCECRLVVVGPDDEGLVPQLERLARDLQIANDVSFLGPLYGDDRLEALASADVWALSSHTENFGIAVVEAMAAGCAVVISPAVNIADDIAAIHAGVVAELEPVAFGEALAAVVTDSGLRERLQNAGRNFAEKYDWSIVGTELAEMYRRVAQHATEPPSVIR